MSSSAVQLVLLPGLGADARLFADLRRRGVSFDTPAWLAPKPGESLRGWVARWVRERPDDFGQAGRPRVLGGMSFGGQVALEAARLLEPESVALISSHPCSDELTPRFRRQVGKLRWIPDLALRFGLRRIGMPAIARREQLQKDQRKTLLAMADTAPLSFFRWACQAAADWQWPHNGDENATALRSQVHRIHGSEDSVIPLGERDERTTVLAGAGHLIPMTHTEDVATWLESQCRIAAS
ncbi:MAG: alpha/beta fold hydrolase [Planctomycetota bacterium]